jgi:hypothetical protein
VPGLVHRGEQRVELVLGVARREANVAEAEGDLERVHGRIEAELVPRRAEGLDELTRELLLRGDRERPVHERVLLVRRVLGDERLQLGRQHGEDLADLVGAHSRLVVLEQHVVRIVVGREALDVLPAQVDDALERWPEPHEIGGLARLDPDLVRLRCGLRELDREIGGNTSRPFPVAPCDADQRGVVRVVRKRRRVQLELLEQLAEPVVDDMRVDDLLERGQLGCPRRRSTGRHEHGHVPQEHRFHAAKVRELGQALLQLGEGRIHRPRL